MGIGTNNDLHLRQPRHDVLKNCHPGTVCASKHTYTCLMRGVPRPARDPRSDRYPVGQPNPERGRLSQRHLSPSQLYIRSQSISRCASPSDILWPYRNRLIARGVYPNLGVSGQILRHGAGFIAKTCLERLSQTALPMGPKAARARRPASGLFKYLRGEDPRRNHRHRRSVYWEIHISW